VVAGHGLASGVVPAHAFAVAVLAFFASGDSGQAFGFCSCRTLGFLER
jgi:hypothetical protein